MKREFTYQEAKMALIHCEDIRKNLQDFSNANFKYKNDVIAATERYLLQELRKELSTIPVEQINQKSGGFRVKNLRQAGYKTFDDLWIASVYELSCVRGISDDSAYFIKRIVSDASDEITKMLKVRLSLDNKTVQSSDVVRSTCQYMKSTAMAEAAQEVLDSYNQEVDIDKLRDDLKPAFGFWEWLFSTKEKKQKAIYSYNYIRNVVKIKYDQPIQQLSNYSNKIKNITDEEGWSIYQKTPIKIINKLEEAVPNVKGGRDGNYGLPEELARKIQEEDFFPDGLLCELRPYQELGVKYILHQERVLLGDEMGLGKTIQAIATMVSLRNTGATHFMVVCPASVIINWCREITKYSRLKAYKIHGNGIKKTLNEWMKNGGVAVTTYETTKNIKFDESFKFSLLVVDEAHYIKNPEANRTIYTVDISKHSNRLLFMTGTALENKVDEMINLIRILRPEVASEVMGLTMFGTASIFREKIASVYYRRKREDVLSELPELTENEEWCSLNSVEQSAYVDALYNESYHAARRVSWNVNDLSYSTKANRMLELVDQAKSEGRKVLIFSFYLDTMQKIRELLGDRCSGLITGSVSPSNRQKMIDDFENNEKASVLCAQIIAGGTGLNIQKASVVIICEPQVKPSIENQAVSRAYRMGQTRNVLLYRLLCENTVDERMYEILKEKQRIFDAFADESVAAQNVEIDNKTMGNIIKEEIERIKAEQRNSPQKATTEQPENI